MSRIRKRANIDNRASLHKICHTSGKKQHAGEKQAQTAANRQRAITGQPIYWYRCPECRQWHITKKEQRY